MYRINLIGNPNVGKSTLFNSLTGANEHTGNYHGVTVDEKRRIIKFDGEEYEFVDLPGIYSLNTFTYEEEISKREILSSNSINLVIIDANSLRRNLYLCIQLIELGIDFKIIINDFKNDKKTQKKRKKYDFLDKNNDFFIKYNEIISRLGIEYRIVNAKQAKLTKDLLDFCKKTTKIYQNFDKSGENHAKNHENVAKMRKNLKYLQIFIQKCKNSINVDDERIVSSLNGIDVALLPKELVVIKNMLPEVIQARYDYIDELLKDKDYYTTHALSRADKFLLNPWIMTVGFLAMFFVSVYLIFFVVGSTLGEWLGHGLELIIFTPFMNMLYALTDNVWLIEFFSNGVFASVLTVVGFVPQVSLLFIFISILEDSGIISRMAYVFDDFLSLFGLSGKAVYIMLLGLGCNSMSTLASRSVSEKNLRIKTAILNPYISCMARLPVYVLLATAFFGEKSYLVVVGLYILGLVVGLIVGLILNKTILKSQSSGLLLEFPPLRRLDIKHLYVVAKTNAVDMFKRVFTIVLSVGVIVWILSHTCFDLSYTASITDSILFTIADKISFIFTPIGLGSAGVVCALIVGLMAKELIVSTFSIANNVSTQASLISSLSLATSVVNFSLPSAVAFLIFVLLYCPCVSNLAVLKREVGTFYMWFSIISQFTIAYMLSFMAYNLLANGLNFVLISILIISIIMLAIIFLMKRVKHTKCLTCGKCR